MELVLQVIADSGFDEGQLGKVNSAHQAGADTSINKTHQLLGWRNVKLSVFRCSRTTCKYTLIIYLEDLIESGLAFLFGALNLGRNFIIAGKSLETPPVENQL